MSSVQLVDEKAFLYGLKNKFGLFMLILPYFKKNRQ